MLVLAYGGKNNVEQYQLKQEIQNLGHSHNNMLQIASESGILGLIGFLGFSIFTIYKSVKSYIMSTNPYDLLIIVGLLVICFIWIY